MKALSITEARNRIMNLPDELKEMEVVNVTRRGRQVLTILPAGLYETIMETLEITDDPELMASLRKSVKQIREGKSRSLKAVRRELGI
jgi:PHD/YefM family antitoxin component YafN of YafNO toxin-antitoxin module